MGEESSLAKKREKLSYIDEAGNKKKGKAR